MLNSLKITGVKMKVKFKNKTYNSQYDAKTNTVYIVDGNNEINEIVKEDRIQRGLLLGTLLNNPIYNLDEAIKNKLL